MPAPDKPPPAPTISLALATYNQAALLRAFLDNYARHGGADRVPLLIIDDGSDDGTPALLSAFRSGLAADARVQVHSLPHVSVAHARDHALRHCATPWLAFSDTDCLLDGAYFDALLRIPERFAGAPAVEGAVLPPPERKRPFSHSMSNPRGGTYATANMAFHVATALSVGGFDAAYPSNYREDVDLALTLIERVGPIPFCADWVVIHPHVPRRFFSALKRAPASQAWFLEAEIRLFEKHPEGYGKVRHHRTVRGTFVALCFKHAARQARESLGILAAPGAGPAQRLRDSLRAAQDLTVAVWEQMCIVRACMVKWRQLARCKAP